MTDVFSKEKRSWIMSRIRSTNTSVDLAMRDILSNLECDYEMYPKIFGNPDFAIRSKNVVIFCDGDFWHGYNFKPEKPMKKYWRDKISRNIKRDARVSRALRHSGWSVLRFWEHDIKKNPEKCRKRIERKITMKELTRA
ncbi:MAG: DUF559 domain-containing protein [Nitrosopumilaceae archaeon]|nr:DUF559 domain-containing protein [Nitrosopumilaceae archaeon]NIU01874.1 DUF559 domain-containing protein [Nitrosopumilaceae archaeon]NIU88278.1 DUF559 domain-containing protein [Nitrosopumilaceae archaeon]NIV66570.1 DUF559 domain-containing protein [Nitrosopumilaceae archaeon]NIX62475.1 DUF559 domain-containing protein [Nitrosopumilaceae archaeon]